MGKDRLTFVCSNCGAQTSSWAGKCSACDSWNSMEEVVQVSSSSKNVNSSVFKPENIQTSIKGKVIDNPRGKNEKSPNMTVTELDNDNGKTIAEVFEQGEKAVAERYLTLPDAWHLFAVWYKSFSR